MINENAKPVLVAEFVTDEKGVPKFRPGGSYMHYNIRLKVKGAPEDAYAVTYGLHETYYDPIRESRDINEDFLEEITSYGDYPVQAIVRSKQGSQTLVTNLSQALALGDMKGDSKEITSAIKYIKDH
jgi:hypothetical protein